MANLNYLWCASREKVVESAMQMKLSFVSYKYMQVTYNVIIAKAGSVNSIRHLMHTAEYTCEYSNRIYSVEVELQ